MNVLDIISAVTELAREYNAQAARANELAAEVDRQRETIAELESKLAVVENELDAKQTREDRDAWVAAERAPPLSDKDTHISN